MWNALEPTAAGSGPAPSPGGNGGGEHDAYLVAIAISLTATCVNNVGMLHMKLSLMKNAARTEPLPVFKQLRWILGFVFYLCGQIGAMVALGFGPQSMLAALGAFSLVVNVFTSPCILGEKLTVFHVFATLVIVGGVCLVVMFSKKTSQHYNISELEHMFMQESFISVASVLLIILFGMFLAYGPCSPQRICRKGADKSTKKTSGNFKDNSQNVLTSDLEHSLNKGLPVDIKSRNSDSEPMDVPAAIASIKPLPPLYCAFIASICSAGTNLFAKCIMAILLAHNASEWYTSLTFWIIFILLGATAVGTVVFLNLGLNSDADALFIVPVFFVMVLLSTTTVAAVYFGDFDGMSAFHLSMLGLGALMTLAGVYALASFDVANDPDLDDNVDDNEDNDETEILEEENDILGPLASSNLIGEHENSYTTAAGDPSLHSPLLSSDNFRNSALSNSGATRRSSLIQMNNRRRRRSSVRFSLKPDAYTESFGTRKSRLPSLAEDVDAESGPDVNDDARRLEQRRSVNIPKLSRNLSAPSVSSGAATGQTAPPAMRRTSSAAAQIRGTAVRPRARTRTYTATLLGGLGIA